MFSGIIEKKGKLVDQKKQGKQIAFTVESTAWDKPLKRGESISINGVCLTVVSIKKNQFTVQAVPETLKQTTLFQIRIKEPLNLERSLSWGDRVGGHFVLGHVDGIGRILRRKSSGKSFNLEIQVPPSVLAFLVPKGSIAVEGISLTIQQIGKQSIQIAVIPHTAKTTTLGKKKVGDLVNLEADVLSKHLTHLVQSKSMESLKK